MKKLFALTLAFGFLAVVAMESTFAGWDPAKAEQERKAAEETITQFKKRDPSMKRFFDNAYGYAVYPTIVAGAFIVGGAHGAGLVYKKGKIIGRSSLSQGSVGLQAGGQSYGEIVFFSDKPALESFKKGHLKFAGQASAIAVTGGASADAHYEGGVAVFTMGKTGLMLQASIGGQRFTFEPKPK